MKIYQMYGVYYSSKEKALKARKEFIEYCEAARLLLSEKTINEEPKEISVL